MLRLGTTTPGAGTTTTNSNTTTTTTTPTTPTATPTPVVSPVVTPTTPTTPTTPIVVPDPKTSPPKPVEGEPRPCKHCEHLIWGTLAIRFGLALFLLAAAVFMFRKSGQQPVAQ